ncbi:MAG: hypothetical protein ACRCYY_01305 [Trueperaceae bacterium]
MISRWLGIFMVLLVLTACTQQAPKPKTKPTTKTETTTPQQPSPAIVSNPALLKGNVQNYSGKASKIVAGLGSPFEVQGTINADGSFELTLPDLTREQLFPLQEQLEAAGYTDDGICDELQVSDESIQVGIVEGLYVLDDHHHIKGMLFQTDSAETLECGAALMMADEYESHLVPSRGSGMLRLYADKDTTASLECRLGGFTFKANGQLKKGWNLLNLTADNKTFNLSTRTNEEGVNGYFVADPNEVNASVLEGHVDGYALGEAVVRRVNAPTTTGEVAIAEGRIHADGSFRVTLPDELPAGISWRTEIASNSCSYYGDEPKTLAPSTELAAISSIQMLQNGVEVGLLEQGYKDDVNYSYLERVFSTQSILLCSEGEQQSSRLEMNAGWNVVSHYAYTYPELEITHSGSYIELDARSLELTPWLLKPAR